MRVLLKDINDNSYMAVEVVEAFKTDCIIADVDDKKLEFYVNCALELVVPGRDDNIYVIMDEHEVNRAAIELAARDVTDLSERADTTFIYPDNEDFKRLAELSSRKR